MTTNKMARSFRISTTRLAVVSTVLVATAACGSDSTSSPDSSTPVAESAPSTETTPLEAPGGDTVDLPEISAPPATAAQTENTAGGPVIVSKPSDTGLGEEAAFYGTLSLQDGCMYINRPNDDNDFASAVVWPDGTTWDASNESVLSASGGAIPMGQPISTGGGFHDVGDIGAFVTDSDAVAEVTRCATLAASDGSIWVIQGPVSP